MENIRVLENRSKNNPDVFCSDHDRNIVHMYPIMYKQVEYEINVPVDPIRSVPLLEYQW